MCNRVCGTNVFKVLLYRARDKLVVCHSSFITARSVVLPSLRLRVYVWRMGRVQTYWMYIPRVGSFTQSQTDDNPIRKRLPTNVRVDVANDGAKDDRGNTGASGPSNAGRLLSLKGNLNGLHGQGMDVHEIEDPSYDTSESAADIVRMFLTQVGFTEVELGDSWA